MFQDILSEIHGTEKQDWPSYNYGFGIRFGEKLPTFPVTVSEITATREYTDTIRNSSGYRCDEFSKDQDGLHILFSGCSVTYGSGLPIDDTWSKRTYDAIAKNHKVGTYVNLARPANSTFGIIADTFKYIKEFGKPDVIALAFPSIFRGYKTDRDKNGVMLYNSHVPLFYEMDSEELQRIADGLIQYVSDYIMMLSMFCETNNIKLYMFVWESELPDVATYRFLHEAYQRMEKFSDQEREIYRLSNGKKEDLLANDDAHLGIAFHKMFADRIIGNIKKDIFNENFGY